jgi:nucleotide-binding universal stress UspA family protein
MLLALVVRGDRHFERREVTTMNTRRILVPDDFTEASREALRYARLLGQTGCHELHLLHVVPDARREPWAGGVEELDLAALTEEWVRDAGIRLQGSACELRSAFDVRTAVRLGTAPEQIVAYASEQHADVIVLGAHRDLRSAEWLRGSVAERVVRKASCPVLTVPGGGRDVAPIDEAPVPHDLGPRLAIRSILIPVDFSANADLALRRGLALAREHGATAHVLHVYDPPWTRNPGYTAPPAHVTEELRYRAERQLGRDIARHHGLPLHVRPVVRVGDPYVEIVHYAGEIGAGVIVLGTHSRHTIGRQMLGSVAQKVLRRAPCPILTVCDEAVAAEYFAPARENPQPHSVSRVLQA